MLVSDVIHLLQEQAQNEKPKPINHFGISANKAFGLKIPVLRKLAKDIGKNHKLASALWKEEYHECKLLAIFIADPKLFTIEQADTWVKDIYSWDICDQLCINVLVKTPYRWSLVTRYIHQNEEYIKRCGIVMIVALKIHDKKVEDKNFIAFIPLLKQYATDPRNFIKKAINWAIRDLGKRSPLLFPEVYTLSTTLIASKDKTAIWIAQDAIKEWKQKGLLH